MDKDREHKIRERAYHLWEDAGRPHGDDDRFWKQALAMEHADTEPAAKAAPVTKPASVPKTSKPAADKPKAAAKPTVKGEAKPKATKKKS